MSMSALKWVRDQRAELGGPAKAVLWNLADRANEAGVCWPSVATICADTGLSRRTVQYALRRLEAEKLVRINQIKGRTSRCILAIPAQEMRTGAQEMRRTRARDAPEPKRTQKKKTGMTNDRERQNAGAYQKPEHALPDVTVDQDVLDLIRNPPWKPNRG